MARTLVSHADEQRIRSLFLARKPSYRMCEAARLLGMSRGALQREAEADSRDAYRVNARWHFTWRQVAYLALRRWTLAEIHDALGSETVDVLPSLLAMRTLTMRLPEYLVRAIEHEAANDDTTVDDWLHQELGDFAGTVVERMERVFRAFVAHTSFLARSRRQTDLERDEWWQVESQAPTG